MSSQPRHLGILWTLFLICSLSVYVGVKATTTVEPNTTVVDGDNTTDNPATTAPAAETTTTTTQSTAGATDAPTTTEAPTTAPQDTKAPTTVPQDTVAPTTGAPTTGAPGSEVNTTETPDEDTTQAETTEAPTTEEETTEAPATEAPATEAPATEAPATEAPATEATTTEAQTTLPPTTTTDKDDCVPDPCVNGTCTDEQGNYTCTCDPGFDGRNCDQDYKECSEKPCKNDAVCSELAIGMGYKCLCTGGWKGVNCTDDIDECTEGTAECRANSKCNNTQGSYECPCMTGFMENDDNICEGVVLYPDFETGAIVVTSPDESNTMDTPIPFPYFGKDGGSIVTYLDGFVSFGQGKAMSSAPLRTDWPYSPNLFGVYWTDIDKESKVYIIDETRRLQNVSMDVPLLAYVKNELNASYPDFEPLYAKVITWKNVHPEPASDYPDDMASIQLILATDSQFSFALVNYDAVWENTEVFNRPHVSAVHSGANGDYVMEEAPQSKSRRNVTLFDESVMPNMHPYTCVKNVQELKAKYGDSSQSLPACPCNKFQAQADYLFKSDDGTSDCFNSRLWSAQGLKQTCCYDSFGQLYVNRPTAMVPLEKSPGTVNFNSTLNQCCTDAPNLCDWFYHHFMSSDCSNYNPPQVGSGFGDPHMVTFDNNQYSFNGLGEYVVIKSGDIELQGRTDKTDANTTFFTLYALRPAENVTVQIYFNETAQNLQMNWYNGDQFTEGEDYDKEQEDKSIKLIFHTFAVTIRKLEKTEGLSHTVAVFVDNFPTMGLMGSLDRNPSNDFVMEGGNEFLGTAESLSGENINEFAEHWRVTNETSLFDYTLPSTTSYEEVNDLDFMPPVLATSPDALLEMFDMDNSTDKAVAQELCEDDLFCLQDFYVNRDNTSATDTKAEGQQIAMEKETFSKVAPNFTNPMDVIELDVTSDNFMMKLMVDGDKTVTYSVSNTVAGVSLVNDTATWNITAALDLLRATNYPAHLRFYATDSDMLVGSFAPPILLCLCEDKTQCRKDWATNDDIQGDITGNVKNLACECGERASGKYCNQTVDVCHNCYNRTSCNNTLEEYCAACPMGYGGDGKSCRDINECATDNGGCEHVCTNLPGSFNCSCNNGYQVAANDSSKCVDINECEEFNYCKNTMKQCVNEIGSVTCSCYPGLYGPNCVRAPFLYLGSVDIISITGQEWSVQLLIEDSDQFKALARKVENSVLSALTSSGLNSSGEMFIVDVMSFEIVTDGQPNNSSRKKRATEGDKETVFKANYIIRSNALVTEANVNEAFKQLISADCTTNCQFGELNPIKIVPTLLTEDPCSYSILNECSTETQTCSTRDNRIYCNCKAGFEINPTYYFSCKDVDECQDETSTCAETSVCTNEYGTFRCGCSQGYEWNATALRCDADKCNPNPCKHDGVCTVASNSLGFVCSCEYDWTGDICDDEETDVRRWKIAVICVSVILGFICLCLLIITAVLCYRNRKTLESHTYTNSRYNDFEGLPRAKVKSEYRDSREMAENGTGSNAYDRLNKTNDDHNYTSFGKHAPTPGNGEGSKQVYTNRAFDASEVGERTDDGYTPDETKSSDFVYRL